MADARFPGLPGDLVQPVRMASVPPYLRALFRRIDVPLGLRVERPEGMEGLPATALQLLKLAVKGIGLRPPVVVPVPTGAPPRVILEYGGKSLVFGPDELAAPTTPLARQLAEELLGPAQAAVVLERFAREAPRQDALRRLTRAMLETQSIDRLRYITLLGMTSGAALGFNRAALFVYDEASRALVGASAIGPYDDEEAHRIWEAIEVHDKTLEEMIADYAASEVDLRFEEFVRTLECSLEEPTNGDEIEAALAATGPLRFTRERPTNQLIAALAPGPEFLVCAIKLRGKPLGVVVADNRYTLAPIDPGALDFISFLLDAAALCSENLRLLESVETLARHDALTGLFNRREFETRMQEEQSRAQRLGSQCGLLMLDIDHFKAVNDTYGHKAGDELLQTVGVLLRSTLRAHDIVARFGGDEFAVLVTDTNAEQVRAIAARVGVQALEQGVSLSIGGSVWPRDNLDASVLFAEADARLYAAKRAGRCRACIETVPGEQVFELGAPG
jgi:diguanylate cyclase (GGDEF)-like protein